VASTKMGLRTEGRKSGDAPKVLREPAALPNGSRLSCGALKKDSFRNLRAPAASSAC